MFEKTYAILSLLEIQNEIKGRKRIQKIFHLLKHLGYEVPFKFTYHFYGPYSSDLQLELSSRANRTDWEPWKEEESDSTYIYKQAEESKNIKEVLEDNLDCKALHYPEELIHTLNGKDAPLLELTSTYAYFIDNEHSTEEAKKRTEEMKPKLLLLLDQAIALYSEIKKFTKPGIQS